MRRISRVDRHDAERKDPVDEVNVADPAMLRLGFDPAAPGIDGGTALKKGR